VRHRREPTGEMWYGKVYQDGLVVAEVQSPDRKRVFAETSHYVRMYSQDGPCEGKITWKGLNPPPSNAIGEK
jgi:hypothetical protein